MRTKKVGMVRDRHGRKARGREEAGERARKSEEDGDRGRESEKERERGRKREKGACSRVCHPASSPFHPASIPVRVLIPQPREKKKKRTTRRRRGFPFRARRSSPRSQSARACARGSSTPSSRDRRDRREKASVNGNVAATHVTFFLQRPRSRSRSPWISVELGGPNCSLWLLVPRVEIRPSISFNRLQLQPSWIWFDRVRSDEAHGQDGDDGVDKSRRAHTARRDGHERHRPCARYARGRSL